MSGKDILPEKDLLEKAAELKKFQYLPLGEELKAQNSAAEKQNKKLDKVFESHKKEEKIIKVRAKTNLVYSKDFTFYKYHNINEFAKRSFLFKKEDLTEFKDTTEMFHYDTEKSKPNNEDQEKDLEKKKKCDQYSF